MGQGKGFAIGSMFTQMRASENNIVTNSLILNLDASNPDSYSGSGTDWEDLTINNNDFTLYNGPTFDSEKGGCIVTDGVNDYIESNVAFSEGTAAMSAFAYVKCTDLATTSSGGTWFTWALNKRPSATIRRFQIYFYATAGDWTTYGYQSLAVNVGINGSNVGDVLGWAQPTVPQIYEDQWYYVGFTTDGVNGGTITMYVNGVAVGSGTLTGDRTVDSQKVKAANDGWSNNFGMPGSTKNIHMYAREITADEVLQNYNAIK